MSFRIDQEFKELIPPLSNDEYLMLEENCKNYRIRDALVVGVFPGSDGPVLIDGHNRYEIAKKNNLAYEEKRIDFPSREDAIDWIIRNQLGRRNIPKYVRGELILKLKPVVEAKAKERQYLGLKSDEGRRTDEELGRMAGVGKDTIRKVEVIQQKAPEETKQALRRGEVSINQVYSGIKAAENETVKQEDARKLREAKRRAEEFEESKVVTFDSVKQNNDDRERIFDNFRDEFSKMISHVRRFAIMAENGELEKVVKMTSSLNQITLSNNLQECCRSLLKIQRVVAEVMDEK